VESQALTPIPGSPPSLLAPPPGCPFAPRCTLRQGRAECVAERPVLREVDGHATACHFAEELVHV
jgi:oligopeptide/dipeptide ABC transporter ATP-binding protein